MIRQNFISVDVGRNKAEVLSERYNDLYDNISVSFVPKYATYTKFDKEHLPDNEYPSSHFVCLDALKIKSNDIIINLVDNEGFKKKLDVFNKTTPTLTFAAGVNLFNGQAYYTTNQNTTGYAIDHADLLNIFDEVSIHSCADHDANGTDENPEQLFGGNDLCASVLSNLFQTVLTDIPLYKFIHFTTGYNLSAKVGKPDYHLLYNYVKPYFNHKSIAYKKAVTYFKLYNVDSVINRETEASKRHDLVLKSHAPLVKFIEMYEGKHLNATSSESVASAEVVIDQATTSRTRARTSV